MFSLSFPFVAQIHKAKRIKFNVGFKVRVRFWVPARFTVCVSETEQHKMLVSIM